MNNSKLTDEQLDELLKEIQQANELPADITEDMLSDNAWGWGDNDEVSIKNYEPHIKLMLRTEAAISATKRASEKRAEKKAIEKQIIETAINDDFIDLHAPLDIAYKKIIVKQRTAEYFEKAKWNADKIHLTVSDGLRRIMPGKLISCWRNFKTSMVPAPDFTWVTLDNSYSYRITDIDAPFYFKPEDCQNIIFESNQREAERVESFIKAFYKYNETGVKLEVSVAQQIAPYRTFLDLLKKKPTWFNDLTIYLKEQLNDNKT